MAGKTDRFMTMPVRTDAEPAFRPADDSQALLSAADGSPVEVVNPNGGLDILLICEHGSNRIPARLGDLGLDAAALASHIAWDPGAAPVARQMAAALDAPLLMQRFSRLAYDCNRPPDAPSAMPVQSEIFEIPGNRALSAADRAARTEALYIPFHQSIERHLDLALAHGRHPAIVTIHSFTPVFHGRPRAVELGLLHDADPRLADAMLALAAGGDLAVRRNEPYGPADGVTHTLKRHALPRGLLNVMIEIRNDRVADDPARARMAARLAALVRRALGRGRP